MAVVSAIGSFFASKSQNKAIARAAETSQKNNTENTALARDIYGQNKEVLSPFVNRGNRAGDQMNALLGLGGAQMSSGGPATATMMPNAFSQFQGQYGGNAGAPYGLGDSPGFMYQPDFSRPDFPRGPYDTPGFGDGHNALMNYGPEAQGMGGQFSAAPNQAMTVAPQGQTAQQAANDAFDVFKNSTGYQFRLGEGLDAVNSAYAGMGGLQSGAAMRGINEYGQNFASNEFGNYYNMLGGQQAVGAGAASSLAGVGQNFAGTVIDANNFNAQNQMSGQLGRQNPFANALGTWGAGVQNVVGTILGGGMGK